MMNYYYKILMNLHRKNYSHLYRPLDLPFAFHLPESLRKSIGWEPVASTNRTESCLAGFERGI